MVIDTSADELPPDLPPPDSLVFDLDGTLWDTCAACARGWNLVVERRGIRFRTITADDVRRVAGKMHDACIRETFVGLGLHDAELQALSDETAIEDNRLIAAEGGELFEGVRDGLIELARTHPLFIVSNCQSGYIELFLQHSGLGSLFRDFECWGNTGRPKPENLARLIERNRLASPWFVGDTPGDQQAAQACGVPFIHAAYGFSACAGAALSLRSFRELTQHVRVAV